MAQIEVTVESLRTAVDEAVFAQALTLADKVAGFSAFGPQIEAIVDGIEVSVRVKPFGLDGRCACPAPYQDGTPCPHAVAAVLTWVRAGPDPAAELRAELDDVLAGLADEAGDCDPDEDRKSTRLNSSHGYISYAVFCLNKKKRTRCTCDLL